MQEKRSENILLFPLTLQQNEPLSQPLTPLIDREEAVASICLLLRSPNVRLLTLTGVGGVGKTRLGFEVVATLGREFADGSYFVPLSSIRNPELLIPTIAHALGLRESEEHSLFEHLKAFLRPKHLLFFLDNFEQVLAAAPLLIALLSACPSLKLLITSRTVLHVQGEYAFSLLPLSLPAAGQLTIYESIQQSPAVQLFVQRAQAARFEFQLTEANAPVIAGICTRLDGIPLALELAAARIKLLSPKALLSRLEHRLAVLTGGGQDIPSRQKSLRETIAWSYDLLSGEEQRLFQRLAVFVDGCELEAIEAICTMLGDLSLPVLDGISQLVDQSLLQRIDQGEQEPRLLMLETLREFALESLAASGEMQRVQQAHAAYYVALAERAEPELYRHQQQVWLARLEQNHQNIRAALVFLDTHGEWLKLARLVAALSWFWYMHGLLYEGQQWVERALAIPGDQLPETMRGKLISEAGVFAGFLGQSELAFVLCQESVPLCKVSRDVRNLCASTFMLVHTLLALRDPAGARALAEDLLAFVHADGDRWAIGASCCMIAAVELYEAHYEQAWHWHERGIALFEEEGDRCMNGLIHMMLADVAMAQGDEAKVQKLMEQGIAMFQQVGASWSLGNYFSFWGLIALRGNHLPRARFWLQQALLYQQEMGDEQGMSNTYALLAQLAACEQDYLAARGFAEQCLLTARSLKESERFIDCLEGLATVLVEQGKALWAAQLWGAIDQLSQFSGVPVSPSKRASRESILDSIRSQLNPPDFISAYEQGQTMTPEQALALLIDCQGEPASSTSSPVPVAAVPEPSMELTRRERDVLWHLAQGLTNAQIAQQLVLTPATVNSYLRSIYSKLGVTSRTAAVRYAIDHHLLET